MNYSAIVGKIAQSVAVMFCLTLGLALIINNQMAGEAMWYWYAVLFHNGIRLYSGIHIALQPLFVFEWNIWMNLFGHRTIATESLSVVHLFILVIGIFALAHLSDWPGWQKAIVIAGGFVFWICGPSYRFDDYHVTTESFVLYSILLLLLFSRTDTLRKQACISLGLGVLCGFAITSRINDGAALLVIVTASILVIATTHRWLHASLFAATALLLTLLIIHCTGDTYSAWLANTIFHAAASKGGSHSIFMDPLLLVINAMKVPRGGKLVFLCTMLLFPVGALITRIYKISVLHLVAIQLGLSALIYTLLSPLKQKQFLSSSLLEALIPFILLVNCLLAVIVLTRWIRPLVRKDSPAWDKREFLIFLPLAMWASIATSAAGIPLTGYYSQVALLILLIAVLQPFARQINFVNGTLLSILLLCIFLGAKNKYESPYFWNSVQSPPMFTHREIYMHPTYGPMYIDKSLLDLSLHICANVGTGPSHTLLSLPFSYANYFCDITPWHGYVESFFDTTEHSTVRQMIREVTDAPPEHIVYQRQLHNLIAHEKEFNHDQRLPQHDLDDLIVANISSGKWRLVYKDDAANDVSWYVIATR